MVVRTSTLGRLGFLTGGSQSIPKETGLTSQGRLGDQTEADLDGARHLRMMRGPWRAWWMEIVVWVKGVVRP